MTEPTQVRLTIQLTISLQLANDIERASRAVGMGIDEFLSKQIIEADCLRNEETFNAGAREFLLDDDAHPRQLTIDDANQIEQLIRDDMDSTAGPLGAPPAS